MILKNGEVIKKLLEDVACLKTDMGWVKKLVYIGAGSSITAALGVLGQILIKLVH